MRPTRAAENEMTGFMWPPEIGATARRRIVMERAMSIDIMRFGVLVSISKVEMTMVSIMKTRTAVPRSSPIDALHTSKEKKSSRPNLSHSVIGVFCFPSSGLQRSDTGVEERG